MKNKNRAANEENDGETIACVTEKMLSCKLCCAFFLFLFVLLCGPAKASLLWRRGRKLASSLEGRVSLRARTKQSSQLAAGSRLSSAQMPRYSEAQMPKCLVQMLSCLEAPMGKCWPAALRCLPSGLACSPTTLYGRAAANCGRLVKHKLCLSCAIGQIIITIPTYYYYYYCCSCLAPLVAARNSCLAKSVWPTVLLFVRRSRSFLFRSGPASAQRVPKTGTERAKVHADCKRAWPLAWRPAWRPARPLGSPAGQLDTNWGRAECCRLCMLLAY